MHRIARDFSRLRGNNNNRSLLAIFMYELVIVDSKVRDSWMYPEFPKWKKAAIGFIQNLLAETVDHLQLLADSTQLNRRTRSAWKSGRAARASYLAIRHHQRRLARRREIRQLVEGPVSENLGS